MKTLLFLSLFFSFSNSYSQNWVQLFENNKGEYFYRTNTNNTAWIKVVSDRTIYKPTNSSNEKIIDG